MKSPRPNPCGQCPYRQDCAPGVWHHDEYEKLKRYDAPTYAQPTEVFMCHLGDGHVCSGWLGHADADQLLAVRLGLARGRISPECLEYKTDVPLFPSGKDAAEHGQQEPDDKSSETIKKLLRLPGKHL